MSAVKTSTLITAVLTQAEPIGRIPAYQCCGVKAFSARKTTGWNLTNELHSIIALQSINEASLSGEAAAPLPTKLS